MKIYCFISYIYSTTITVLHFNFVKLKLKLKKQNKNKIQYLNALTALMFSCIQNTRGLPGCEQSVLFNSFLCAIDQILFLASVPIFVSGEKYILNP